MDNENNNTNNSDLSDLPPQMARQVLRSRVPHFLNRRSRNANDPESQSKPENAVAESSTGNDQEPTEFSPQDVLAIKDYLSKTCAMPVEVVDMIMDRAEIWAVTKTVVDYSTTQDGSLRVPGSKPEENTFLFRTPPIGLCNWSPASNDIWRNAPDPAKSLVEASPLPHEKLDAWTQGDDTTVEHPVRKVVFDLVSHDQGWGGDGPKGQYHHSWTWFDAGKDTFNAAAQCPEDCPERQDPNYDPAKIPTCTIRANWPVLDTPAEGQETPQGEDPAPPKFKHELLGNDEHIIQRNKLATKGWEHHHVEWSWQDDIHPDTTRAQELANAGRGKATGNGEFVRNLRLGDMITVWAKARFPGWYNDVQKAEVRVYWAV